MRKHLMFLTVLILATAFPTAAQQEITVRIREGMPAIPVALPEFRFTENSLADEGLKKEMYETLWADLEFSRIFTLIPREHYSYIARLNPDKIVMKDWASIQANILMVGLIEASGDDRLIFSLNVYEVNSERLIFGRNFGSKKEFSRLIAHRAADEMMKQFGEKPIFTTKTVFVSERDNDKEIYIMDYDGHRQTRITINSAIDILPSWSADNEKITYTSYRRLSPELYLFDIYAGRTELVASGGSNYAADWSSDGERIVFTSSRDGNAEIYSKNMKTGALKRLTFNPVIDSSPCWSPSGREIAFTSERSGTPQIYIMDAEGANVRRITFEGSYHDSPTWSPDGTRIAFVSRINSNFDIYIYNLKSNELSKLTEKAGRNENPSWSPDSRHLVFSSNRSGQYQIYLVDYDGQNVRRITSAGENKMPKWQRYVK